MDAETPRGNAGDTDGWRLRKIGWLLWLERRREA